MCDLFKTRAEIIAYYFEDEKKYTAWGDAILEKLNKSGVRFADGITFVPMVLFPEKREDKTEGGLFKPETSDYHEGLKIKVGQSLYLSVEEGRGLTMTTKLIIVRPYGNIDLGSDVWLVPTTNVLFTVGK